MQQRVFLKLDGVWGESKRPQHFGEIELTGFSWGGLHPSRVAFEEEQGTVLIHDLTITKRSDRTSRFLLLACAMKQKFAIGRLTIEEVSESGNLVHSMILKLRHILINSITANTVRETVTLNFRRARLMAPQAENIDKERQGELFQGPIRVGSSSRDETKSLHRHFFPVKENPPAGGGR
jgi:type VI secretion system secreted protein Hcp